MLKECRADPCVKSIDGPMACTEKPVKVNYKGMHGLRALTNPLSQSGNDFGCVHSQLAGFLGAEPILCAEVMVSPTSCEHSLGWKG